MKLNKADARATIKSLILHCLADSAHETGLRAGPATAKLCDMVLATLESNGTNAMRALLPRKPARGPSGGGDNRGEEGHAAQLRRDSIDLLLSDALTRLGGYPADVPIHDFVRSGEIQWWAFPQSWPSTACGHGGIGGQAFTTAQTVVVIQEWPAPHASGAQGEKFVPKALVYLARRFAYEVPFNHKVAEAVSRGQMPSKAERGKLL